MKEPSSYIRSRETSNELLEKIKMSAVIEF